MNGEQRCVVAWDFESNHAIHTYQGRSLLAPGEALGLESFSLLHLESLE